VGVGVLELRLQVAAIAAQHGARRRREQHALGLSHAVAAQEVGASGLVAPRPPGPVVDECRELAVHLVQVARRVLVQDHDVRAQSLEPPVLLGLQHLAHERQVVLLDDAHQQDRQVARDRMRPQPRLAELVPREEPGSAQRAIAA
jgi:hypothetical protein